MEKTIDKFNDWIANKLAFVLSSMWLFWILIVVLTVLWFLDPPDNAFEVSLFVISTAFQAVALPVLALVNKIQGDRQEKVTRETHSAVLAELNLLKQEHTEFHKIIKTLKQIQDN